MTHNIIGEEFNKYVVDQINSRQKIQGKGLDGKRSPEDIQYLSNKNAWIKLASGVSVEENEWITKMGIPSPENFTKDKIAKKAILFNSMSELQDNKTYIKRSGVSKSTDVWNNNSMYGLGGSQMGLQPPPGITSISIDTVNMGSVRKATVNITAFNKFQFELLDMLYMRIGFSMLLEWGWDKYISNDDKLNNTGNTLIEEWWFENDNASQFDVLDKIEEYRKKYQGNYDGFFGKVVNYSWKFGKDGSYNITLSLITMGDVIESIQIKTPSENINNNNTSPVKALESSALEEWLNEHPADNPPSNWNKDNFFTIKNITLNNITRSQLTGTQQNIANLNKQQSTLYDDVKGDEDWAIYSNYLTFGMLMEIIRWNIPIIKNGTTQKSWIDIDFNSPIYVKAFPNQISIDPRICLFKPLFYADDFIEVNAGYQTPKKYLTAIGAEKLVFGNLTNLYINYDFIIKLLKNNTDSNGKLSLYKFLELLCVGINAALGGVNKIQPILKDDLKLTFIDQALQSSPVLKKETSSPAEVANIEIYGYNRIDNTSTFVTDISFETKLNKDTSTLMSIGATAGGGNSIKNGDATMFSKWSEGLKDRFCQSIIDPSQTQPSETFTQPTIFNQTGLDLPNKIQTRYRGILIKYFPQLNNPFFKNNKNEQGYIDYNKIASITDQYLQTSIPGITTVNTPEQYSAVEIANLEKNKYKQQYDEIKQTNPEVYATDVETAYLAYICEAFSGTTKPNPSNVKSIAYSVNKGDGKYLLYNNDFIERGKTLYKSYISSKSQKIYQATKKQSSTNGFLPLVMNLTLDGISGMKIYNKINISQNILPSNYPTSFDFIISKLNHKIDINGWNTQIGTIVTSGIDDNPIQYISEGENLTVSLLSSECKTSYNELPIWKSPLPPDTYNVKDAAKYLKNKYPQGGLSAFAIMIAEARRTAGGTLFSSSGGYNFGGVQTDSGKWAYSNFSGQYCKRDSGNRNRMFAMFKTPEDFMDFLVNRVKAKNFPLGEDGNKWTTTYINNWWSPVNKQSITQETVIYKQKLNIYNTAKRIYNS